MRSPVLVVLLTLAAPAAAKEPCAELWTIAGTAGSEEPWLRPRGYRIGMSKMQASNMNRGGLRGSMAQDTWQFMFSSARIVLQFEKNKLASGTLMLQAGDYEKVRADLIETLGQPERSEESFSVWRSEECNTVKILVDDAGQVSLAIQSLDFHKRHSGSAKTE